MTAYHALAAVYDRLTVDVDYQKRADHIRELLASFGIRGGILLDAACGTGAMSECFARAGFDVIGTDISPAMLTVAQNKKYASGLDILYLLQDIRALDLYGTVDCAVCCLDSINHLPTPDDVGRAFASIGFFMEKGGIFIFDVNTAYKHAQVLGDRTFVYDLDDLYCVWQNEYDDKAARTDIHMDIFMDRGNGYVRESEDFSEWYYTDALLEEKLADAHFQILARYGELTRLPPAEKEERVYYVCKKTKDQ